MKSLISFSHVLLQELGKRCGCSTDRDWKTISVRLEHEGLSFYTIVLPTFARDLEKGLSLGYVDHTMFSGFQKHGGTPRFLGGFLDLVFDRSSGCLLDTPDAEAVRCIRQFCLMFAKIRLDCTSNRVASAIQGYIECEQQMKTADELSEDLSSRFSSVVSRCFGDVLTAVDLSVYNNELIPKHGPGSTADGLLGNEKYGQSEWTSRLEAIFPFGEYVLPSWRHYNSVSSHLLEPGAERPVKVISVPKTAKTPRIIAVEPTCMQYMQQALFNSLERELRRHDYLWNLIGWRDQNPNRVLARHGSLHGDLATLDLSEASDRVSNQHVRLFLRHHPWLAMGVDACRSRKADVPGHGVIRLSKFASMGSALTFPVESMIFFSIVVLSIEEVLGHPLSRRDLSGLDGKVRVYGDDIIVPVDYAEVVIRNLEAFGLKINRNKSFLTGKFRESCGGDYFRGSDVSIVRVRSVFPTSRQQADECVSTVSLRNQLFHAGFDESVQWLDVLLTRVLPAYPEVLETSRALGRHVYSLGTSERFDVHLHRPLVKACVVDAPLPRNEVDGVGALQKWFLKPGDLPFADKKHLLRSGRPRSVRIKTRWVSPV